MTAKNIFIMYRYINISLLVNNLSIHLKTFKKNSGCNVITTRLPLSSATDIKLSQMFLSQFELLWYQNMKPGKLFSVWNMMVRKFYIHAGGFQESLFWVCEVSKHLNQVENPH